MDLLACIGGVELCKLCGELWCFKAKASYCIVTLLYNAISNNSWRNILRVYIWAKALTDRSICGHNRDAHKIIVERSLSLCVCSTLQWRYRSNDLFYRRLPNLCTKHFRERENALLVDTINRVNFCIYMN